MSAFTKSWLFLKTEPIDMQQGSDGTWRAPNDTPPNDVSPEEKLWQQIQARNAQARQNLQKPAQVAQPKPTPQPGYSGWM